MGALIAICAFFPAVVFVVEPVISESGSRGWWLGLVFLTFIFSSLPRCAQRRAGPCSSHPALESRIACRLCQWTMPMPVLALRMVAERRPQSSIGMMIVLPHTDTIHLTSLRSTH